MSRLTFKYRLCPNRQQREKLEATLGVCRALYNGGLEERREAWSSHRKSIGYLEQANQLSEIKAIRTDIAAVHSQVLQDVLRRFDKARPKEPDDSWLPSLPVELASGARAANPTASCSETVNVFASSAGWQPHGTKHRLWKS